MLQLQNTTLRHNRATSYGGAIYMAGRRREGARLHLRNVIVQNCKAYHGGAAYVSSGAVLQLENTTLRDNRAQYSGGGIYVPGEGMLRLKNATLRGNRA
eukprot:gene8677-3505_t